MAGGGVGVGWGGWAGGGGIALMRLFGASSSLHPGSETKRPVNDTVSL